MSFSSSKDKNPIDANLTYYGPSIPEDNGEVDLVRSDIPATVIKVYPCEFVAEEPENESEDKDEMNQGEALKKKVLNSNNGSSPINNAMCSLNSQNRKKQKWWHRMGPVNFGRVSMALHATKENNEEP
ncbi:hypothetical protein KY289_022414 [Solanum tuberosum]|nr:hypothetical protein KY289_022414 [Solanum tuberosum]